MRPPVRPACWRGDPAPGRGQITAAVTLAPALPLTRAESLLLPLLLPDSVTSGGNPPMPRTTVVTPALLAAALTLTACGPAAGSPASGAPSPSCLQQYRAWESGPAHGAGENLVVALNAVQAASSALDASTTSADLERAGAAAGRLARSPLPKCADPKGYWHAVIARVRSAADNASRAKGMASLLIAEAPLRQMPALERSLAAELKQTLPGLNQRN